MIKQYTILQSNMPYRVRDYCTIDAQNEFRKIRTQNLENVVSAIGEAEARGGGGSPEMRDPMAFFYRPPLYREFIANFEKERQEANSDP